MDKLLDILSEIKPGVDFSVEKDLIDKGIFDSIEIVTIIEEIEEHFHVTVDPDNIDPDNFQSADAMWNMIQNMK